MIKSLFYGIGIPAIYFGVSFALSSLFDTPSNTVLLITFGCPLVVTFIVALISEAVREEEEYISYPGGEYEPSLKACRGIFDVIEKKVIPLLNGTRDRSWVNWNELTVWGTLIKREQSLDLLGCMVSCVLRTHHASPYILDHTGITYVSEDGFEIRRFE